MKRIALLFWLVALAFSSIAEQKQLSIVEYLEIVKKYHPVYQQTNLAVKKSVADIMSSRGAFDPIFKHYFSTKTFDGKNYYQSSSPEIIIPTWFGTDFNLGTQSYAGTNVDPTQTLGNSSFIGINIPLAKDLIIDKRRAALSQAKLMNKMSLQDQRAVLNQLHFDASVAYLEWSKAHQLLKTVEQILSTSQNRFELIKKSFLLGERPAIDTLEAHTQIQFYQNARSNSFLEVQKSTIGLSAFLWNEQQQNVILPTDVLPDHEMTNTPLWLSFELSLEKLIERAEEVNPELKAYDFKLGALKIEKQLKFQNLLPKIDLNYQQLAPGNQFQNMFASSSIQNNYYAGLKIELPIPLRFGRAEFEKAKIKYQDEQINQQLKRNSIQIKVKQYHTEFSNLKQQVQVQNSLVDNYKLLVKSEEIRLNNGEGSLFMINSRELKALESMEKLIDLKNKYFKSIFATQWAAGLLALD